MHMHTQKQTKQKTTCNIHKHKTHSIGWAQERHLLWPSWYIYGYLIHKFVSYQDTGIQTDTRVQ